MGHLLSAKAAVEALGLDKLVLMPAGTPPHKTLPAGSPTGEERLEMVRLAADSLLLRDKVEVSDLELLREGKSYTVDTLRTLREQYPGDELWLLMGTDMFLSLQNWREPETICSLVHLCAFARTESDTMEKLEAQGDYLKQAFGAESRVIAQEQVVPVSSTLLRELLGKGEGQEYLASSVYGYILRKGLYGVHTDLKYLSDDDLRACSLSMVYAKRHAHIRGVEEEAVRLARRWGAAETDARRAGILHDCTKYWTKEEHLACCDRYGVELDSLERENEKLLHAKSGAAVARHIYGENEAVYQAILWHTTGKAHMSLLEKIIYIADYMEPNRDFDGVEELRRLAYTDLDEAVKLGLSMSIEDLTRRGAVVHKDTQGAIDWLNEHGKGN
ncbi:MAG: bis(5'-nucleosyl)-tetraphosphatase (symmetrical) YqeK [Oscillospiraceae bacterium]|nr:bis(5'-nucleosyl)-tetraphosphatase (symmetrical) YqeK [Oscillospiraceae bacterium]